MLLQNTTDKQMFCN